MTRVVSLHCGDCNRRFGGTETFRKHRYNAGDQERCIASDILRARGWIMGPGLVWHRPLGKTAKRPSAHVRPTESDVPSLFEAEPRDYPGSLYNGSPPSERVTTSEAAASSMKVASNSIRGRVLEVIRVRGSHGATDDEIEEMFGMRHQTVSARRRELYLLGKIQSTGERKTRSGRRAKVWVVR